MLVPLLNRVVDKSQYSFKIIFSKMLLISKIYKEAITVTPIHRDLEENGSFQILLKDVKVANNVVEELEDELNNIIGKFDVIKDLNKNRFQEVSKEFLNLNEILKKMKMHIDLMKNQMTIVNKLFQG